MNNQTIEIKVMEADETLENNLTEICFPLRIDKYLSVIKHESLISRQFIDTLISGGHIRLNKKTITKKSYLVNPEDEIEITLPSNKFSLGDLPVGQDIPLSIIFEDEHLAIIDKPVGLTVHPAPGHYDGTLVNALVYHFSENLSEGFEISRPGIVHRLDKDTSGLLIIAKDNKTHLLLSEMIQKRMIKKTYQAIILGTIEPENGEIFEPIKRHPGDRKKMAVGESGKEALTKYETIHSYEYFTHLSIELITGRTHQIRVHFTFKNHPVLGDPIYNSLQQTLSQVPSSYHKKLQALLKNHLHRQALHASKLEFIHPITNQELIFTSPLPKDFLYTLEWLNENFT